MIYVAAGQTIASLEVAAREIDGAIAMGLVETADQAAAFARTSALYKSHTYGLRGSITNGEAFFANGLLGARTTATASYAGFVENGTKPHEIRPRRAKMLRFVQNGAVRFANLVRHPGTKPRPFMQQARDKAEPLLERNVSEAIDRVFR